MKRAIFLAAMFAVVLAKKEKMDELEEKLGSVIPNLGLGALGTVLAIKIKVVLVVVAVAIILALLSRVFGGGKGFSFPGLDCGTPDYSYYPTDSYAPSSSYGPPSTSYGIPTHGRALGKANDINFVARVLDSVDLADLSFNVLDVESESCRRRFVCEADQLASKHSVIGYALRLVGDLSRYRQSTVDNGKDCNTLYPDCPNSMFEMLKRSPRKQAPARNAETTPTTSASAN